MIHDPLCSNEGDPFRTGWCNVCILIKAVRDDERARIRAAVEAAWKAGFAPVMNFGLRGDPKPYPLEPSCYECNGEQYGADAAMDVVLAIIDGDADA